VAATHSIVMTNDPTNLTATKTMAAVDLRTCLAANTCMQLPYNYARGVDFFQLDSRFAKFVNFGDKAKLEFFFQAFDMTNRANFGTAFQGNIRAGNFQRPTGFISTSGVVVPKSFAGEFGGRFTF
jgi:hypothetical protein